VKALHIRLTSIVAAALLTGCAGTPVQLGTRSSVPMPTNGVERSISAEACGFQLLLLIPINTNDRMASAYRSLVAQAGNDYITDVQIQERWGYRFVGTSYCTALTAKAIRTGAG
jgi:hypothetical protein